MNLRASVLGLPESDSGLGPQHREMEVAVVLDIAGPFRQRMYAGTGCGGALC